MSTLQFWIARLRRGKDDPDIVAENARRCMRALRKDSDKRRARPAGSTTSDLDNQTAATRWGGGLL
jgi:hypothetical protein